MALRAQQDNVVQHPARPSSAKESPQRRALAAALLGLACGAGGLGRRRRARAAGPGRSGGKVAVITGASTGIGKATALELARCGQYGRVFLAGHNEDKTRAAMADIKQQLGEPSGSEAVALDFLPLELSSLASVREAAKRFQETGLPLHTLICNAAVMALPERRVTEDGYEFQFEVNYLGHFLLVNLLLPQLQAAGSPGDPARVISVSSSAHFVKSPLAFGDVTDLNLAGPDGDKYAYYPWTAYGQSKLAQVMFTYELARRCEQRGLPIAANVLDPGFVDTELQRNLPQQAPSIVTKFLAKTPQRGAETPVLLATSDAGRTSGGYWADSKPADSLGRGTSPLPISQDLAVEGTTSYESRVWGQLWERSARFVGLTETV